MGSPQNPLNPKDVLSSVTIEAVKGFGRMFLSGAAFAGYAEVVNALSKLPSGLLRDALKMAEDREATP